MTDQRSILTKLTLGNQWVIRFSYRVIGEVLDAGTWVILKQLYLEVQTYLGWELPHGCIDVAPTPWSSPVHILSLFSLRPWDQLQLRQNLIWLVGKSGWIFRWGSNDPVLPFHLWRMTTITGTKCRNPLQEGTAESWWWQLLCSEGSAVKLVFCPSEGRPPHTNMALHVWSYPCMSLENLSSILIESSI